MIKQNVTLEVGVLLAIAGAMIGAVVVTVCSLIADKPQPPLVDFKRKCHIHTLPAAPGRVSQHVLICEEK